MANSEATITKFEYCNCVLNIKASCLVLVIFTFTFTSADGHLCACLHAIGTPYMDVCACWLSARPHGQADMPYSGGHAVLVVSD